MSVPSEFTTTLRILLAPSKTSNKSSDLISARIYVTVPSKAELRTLQELVKEKSLSELSEDIGYSLSYTSEVVVELEEKGLVDTRKEGRRRLVSPSESKATQLYRKLIQEHSHVDWEELLTGKALEVLYYLDEPASVSELAEKTDNYRATVHRILDRFTNRGIIQKRDSQYRLKEDFRLVNDFAKEYFHQVHRGVTSSSLLVNQDKDSQTETRFQQVQTYGSESYDILWESIDSFLVRTDKNLRIDGSDFHLTGPERFGEYGIELITTDDRYYFYSEDIDEIEPEDLVCHTLLIEDGVRYRTYCLLLIQKESIAEEVMDASKGYGIESLVESLVDYLAGEQTEPDMPSRAEFESAAEKYGVRV